MTASVARSGPLRVQAAAAESKRILAAFLFRGPAALLKQRPRVEAHCIEGLRTEAIFFRLRLSNKIAHRGSAQPIEESEDRAFLNSGRGAPPYDSLLARRVEHCQAEDRALSLERSLQRRLDEEADSWRKLPVGFLRESQEPASFVFAVQERDVADEF